MLVALGMKPENILAVDRDGVLYTGRGNMDTDKQRYARDTAKRTLAEIVEGADIFLGLSAGGVLKPAMVATMAERPIILALANPYPEILPEDAPRCATGLHHRDGPLGLSEPGQQRAVLPLHLPRRARRGRDHDQRSDEAGLRALDCRTGAQGSLGWAAPMPAKHRASAPTT
jgi:hypothetical protein